MSTGTFPSPGFPPPPLAPPRRGAGGVLLPLLMIGGGGLILLGVLAVAGVGYALSLAESPGYSVAEVWPDDLWQDQIYTVVDESDIPRSEKTQIMEHAERLAGECQARNLDRQALESVLQRLELSPVFVVLDRGGIEREIIAQSGLSADEKRQGGLALCRAVRGVCAGKITIGQFYGALPTGYYIPAALVPYLSEQGLDRYLQEFDAEMFEPTNDEEVRASLARLAQLADAAGIPEEPWSVDVSDQFGQAVDQALAGGEGV